MLKRSIFCFLGLFALTIVTLPAEILFESDSVEIEIPEHDTLSYRAKVIASTKKDKGKKPLKPVSQPELPKIDIAKLVKDGIDTTFNAYRSNYDQMITQERNQLSSMGMGARHSSGAQLIPGKYAKIFSETIINQIAVLAQPLSAADRQTFWNIASEEMKKKMREFCGGSGGASGDLDQHIDSLINMKKLFG